MNNETYTEDLRNFGNRELYEAGKLLTAYATERPIGFDYEGVRVAFNMNSGFVFLTNNEYQCAMVDDDGALFIFYSSPYSGIEGSWEDLEAEYDGFNDEDMTWFDGLPIPRSVLAARYNASKEATK